MTVARQPHGRRPRTQGRAEDPLVTVSLHVRQGQRAALDQLAEAAHTSRAALVREAIDRTAHPPEPPVIVAHGRRSSDTFDATT
jgi:Ribbon-helix-helix protein, copG family